MKLNPPWQTTIISAAAFAALAACGFHPDPYRGKKDEDGPYTYAYQAAGCSTGAHSFKTKSEFCEALLDEGLNASCAAAERRLRYQSAHCDAPDAGPDQHD